MFNLSTQRFATSALCCASVLLAACGGGSSGTGAVPDQAAATQTGSSSVVNTPPAAPSVPAEAPTTAEAPAEAKAPVAKTMSPVGQDANQYQLTFSEEFDSYNTNVWNDSIWYEGSNGTKNYTVEDGTLKIWPERDASGNFFNRTIDTDGKYYQTYGYFEMEAKLPHGKGVWPAFWLLNHDAPAPNRPEIDILEAYPGGGPNSGWGDANLKPTAFATTVWPTGIENGHAGTKTHQNLGDLSADFHTYAVKWEPNKLTFFMDGKEIQTVNASMDKRMYILLDLWYGSASGTPDGSTPTGKSNSFEVNYVRAWQFK